MDGVTSRLRKQGARDQAKGSAVHGTGIVNTLLFDLPFTSTHAAFRALGAVFLVFDMVLFLSFTLLTITRYILYPRIFGAMIRHETHSLFLGCIPMGFVTIISGIASTGHEYGLNTLDAALVLYWISTALSILTAFGVPYFMFTQQAHAAERMTAAWLLPIVPLITQAAVGSTLCKLLLSTSPARLSYCLTLLIASYLQAGIGLLLACAIIVMYLQRLVLHHLPPREVIVSSWLPVGPIGQGGFALIELGRVAVRLFPLITTDSHTPELQFLGPAMLGAAVVLGLLFWGLGIWFAFLAIACIVRQHAAVQKTEEGRLALFNMGVCASIFTFSVLLLWVLVFIPTCLGFFRGTLFAAPCLQSLPKEYVERMRPGSGAQSRAPSRERERRRSTEKGSEREVEGTDRQLSREAREVLSEEGLR
ncbi:Plasma membrane sulfite pump involved in sulfite metabolism [Rhodosporidiobolus nylandii]